MKRIFNHGFEIATFFALVLAALIVVCVAAPDWDDGVVRLFVKPSGPSPTLDLHASALGQYFRVSWNPDVAARWRSEKAVLYINDGGLNRNLNLSPADLRIGKLIYVATSADLRFRLEISSDYGAKVSESVLVLGSGTPLPSGMGASMEASADRSMSAQANTNIARSRNVSAKTSQVPRSAQKILPFSSAPTAKRNLGHASAPAQDIVTIESSSITPATLSPVILGPPSELNLATTTPSSGVDLRILRAQDRTVSYTDRPPPSKAPKVTAIPVEYPQALMEVQPMVPKEIRNLMTSAQTVDVRVTINERGQVITAAVVSARGPLSGLLTRFTVDAARRWVFRPARMGDKNIPSEHVISFVFSTPH